MTCREFVEFLVDYLEGALSDQERRVFDEHLAICPSCVNYLASYRETVQLGKAALRAEDDAVPSSVPEELVQAILAARALRD